MSVPEAEAALCVEVAVLVPLLSVLVAVLLLPLLAAAVELESLAAELEELSLLQTIWSGTETLAVEQICWAKAMASFFPVASQDLSRQQAMPSRNCLLLQMHLISSCSQSAILLPVVYSVIQPCYRGSQLSELWVLLTLVQGPFLVVCFRDGGTYSTLGHVVQLC